MVSYTWFLLAISVTVDDMISKFWYYHQSWSDLLSERKIFHLEKWVTIMSKWSLVDIPSFVHMIVNDWVWYVQKNISLYVICIKNDPTVGFQFIREMTLIHLFILCQWFPNSSSISFPELEKCLNSFPTMCNSRIHEWRDRTIIVWKIANYSNAKVFYRIGRTFSAMFNQ